MKNTYISALRGIRVLDLTQDRGLYTGKFLADNGADVILIEKPGGSNARRMGPFKNGLPGTESSLYFINYNTNKKSITLDIEKVEGQEILKKLVRDADVIIEDLEPGKMLSMGLDFTALQPINPRLIMAAVTGFGQNGPYRQYKSPDIVNFAMGGLMFQSGATQEPPVVAPCEQAFHASSLMTAFGIIAALFLRLNTGKGQYIDVSSHEVVSCLSEAVMRYSVNSEIGGRTGGQFGAGRIYPCQDGYVHLMIIYSHHWQSFLDLMGNPDVLSDPAWYDGMFRLANVDIIDPIFKEFMMKKSKKEITDLCQSKGIPCTAVNTPEDVFSDPHMIERGFTTELEHPVIGRYRYLAPPYMINETPGSIQRPAPLLGQHNTEVFQGELGFSDLDIQKLKTNNII
jgi:CoA:oxalate CoA-transferase